MQHLQCRPPGPGKKCTVFLADIEPLYHQKRPFKYYRSVFIMPIKMYHRYKHYFLTASVVICSIFNHAIYDKYRNHYNTILPCISVYIVSVYTLWKEVLGIQKHSSL